MRRGEVGGKAKARVMQPLVSEVKGFRLFPGKMD